MAAADPIPHFSSLKDIYTASSLLTQAERWDKVEKMFESQFGEKPKKIVRAPGRVNIIGEHIDYSGFAVLPAAIERDLLIAISWHPSVDSNHKIILRNFVPKYEESIITFPASDVQAEAVDLKKDSWSNYFKAALKGILSHFKPTVQPLEIHALVHGTVPAGGGVSSSAAFVTASGLAVIEAFGVNNVNRGEFTELIIESETWVGVRSGGMDQSASVFSLPQSLLHIHFVPKLLAIPVPLPKVEPRLSFVIANTLITSDKRVTAKIHYNLRVVECRIASILLNKALGTSLPLTPVPTLRAVMDAHFKNGTTQSTVESSIAQLQEMSALVDEHFGQFKDGLTWNEVYSKIGLDPKQFEEIVITGIEVEAEKLQMYKRTKHVFEEALRVYQFRDTLEKGGSDPNTIKKLGELMNQSQDSCRDLYNCSCPEIDELINIGRECGSLGSRLTGAGWGGCTVHLIPETIEQKFMESLKEKYYKKNFPDLFKQDIDFSQWCFSTKPEAGACIYDM